MGAFVVLLRASDLELAFDSPPLDGGFRRPGARFGELLAASPRLELHDEHFEGAPELAEVWDSMGEPGSIEGDGWVACPGDLLVEAPTIRRWMAERGAFGAPDELWVIDFGQEEFSAHLTGARLFEGVAPRRDVRELVRELVARPLGSPPHSDDRPFREVLGLVDVMRIVNTLPNQLSAALGVPVPDTGFRRNIDTLSVSKIIEIVDRCVARDAERRH